MTIEGNCDRGDEKKFATIIYTYYEKMRGEGSQVVATNVAGVGGFACPTAVYGVPSIQGGPADTSKAIVSVPDARTKVPRREGA